MTEYKCASCLNKVETFDKNDGIVIVYNCRYCEEETAKLAMLCGDKVNAVATEGCKIELPRITRKVQLPDMSLYERGKA